MSLVTTEEVEARMSTGLETEALQDLIDQQESYLARSIGPLTGERTITLRPNAYHGPIFLMRNVDVASISIDVNGATLDADTYLVTGSQIARLQPTRWDGTVEVTFEPTDENEVKSAVLALVRLAITDSPYSAETGEGHSYSRTASYLRQRAQIAKSLQPSLGPTSVPLGG